MTCIIAIVRFELQTIPSPTTDIKHSNKLRYTEYEKKRRKIYLTGHESKG